jgi:hypothetical protein
MEIFSNKSSKKYYNFPMLIHNFVEIHRKQEQFFLYKLAISK